MTAVNLLEFDRDALAALPLLLVPAKMQAVVVPALCLRIVAAVVVIDHDDAVAAVVAVDHDHGFWMVVLVLVLAVLVLGDRGRARQDDRGNGGGEDGVLHAGPPSAVAVMATVRAGE